MTELTLLCLEITHGRTGLEQDETKSQNARTWIMEFLELCDHAPDIQGMRLLTTETTIRSVYNRYMSDQEALGYAKEDLASEILFQGIWANCGTCEEGYKNVQIGSVIA